MAFGQERIEGVPVLVGHTRPAGTPLDEALVVPIGTVLLGEPIAIAHPLSNVRRWGAAFVVTGHVPSVVAELHAQLAAAGHRVASGPGPASRGDDPSRPTVTFALSAVRDHPVGERRLAWAEGARAQAPPGLPSASYLYLEVTAERPGTVAERDWGSTIEAATGVVDDLPMPDRWPDLPSVDEPIFPTSPEAGSVVARALRVPRGTSPIGPPVGSRVVLVQERGRVAKTFDDLVAQSRRAIGATAMVIRAPDANDDGVRVRFVTIGERAGTQHLLLRAVEQRGHPSYLVLELTDHPW